MDFVFGFQTLWLKDFSTIYQLKGLKPKNKGHTNFYESLFSDFEAFYFLKIK